MCSGVSITGQYFITFETASSWWFLSLRMIGFDLCSVDENGYRYRKWNRLQGADRRLSMWLHVFFLDKRVLVTLTEEVGCTS